MNELIQFAFDCLNGASVLDHGLEALRRSHGQSKGKGQLAVEGWRRQRPVGGVRGAEVRSAADRAFGLDWTRAPSL